MVHGRRIEESAETKIDEPEIQQEMTWEDYTKLAAICLTVIFVLLLFGSVIKNLIRRRRKKDEKTD